MPEEAKNETTNAVLKEMIIGLTKITDDRLGNLKDAVAEIKVLMQGYATKSEVEEIKKDFERKIEDSNKMYIASIQRMEAGAKQHNEDDKVSFGTLTAGQRESRDTLLKWGAILGFILIVISFFAPAILKYIFKFNF